MNTNDYRSRKVTHEYSIHTIPMLKPATRNTVVVLSVAKYLPLVLVLLYEGIMREYVPPFSGLAWVLSFLQPGLTFLTSIPRLVFVRLPRGFHPSPSYFSGIRVQTS